MNLRGPILCLVLCVGLAASAPGQGWLDYIPWFGVPKAIVMAIEGEPGAGVVLRKATLLNPYGLLYYAISPNEYIKQDVNDLTNGMSSAAEKISDALN